MIRTLTGTVTPIETGQVILTVHGIGYLVHVTDSWSTAGQTTTLWTHLAVRENSLDLYGFATAFECQIFEELLTIPKIGPKSALQIMNKAGVELLLRCVSSRDPEQLAKLSGLGKKTAEKVVTALQDSNFGEASIETTATSDPVLVDVEATLIALGYPERVAYAALQEIVQQQPELQDQQALIRAALQLLSR